MATTSPILIAGPSHKNFAASASQLGKQMEREDEDSRLGHNRSSSLSDIGDRGSEHNQPTMDSDPNDTEAETERLEDTPQKSRRNQNLVLTAANSMHRVSRCASPLHKSIEHQGSECMRHDSSGTSPRAASDEGHSTIFASRSPRKRKRFQDADDGAKDQPIFQRLTSDSSVPTNPFTSQTLMKYHGAVGPDIQDNSREASVDERREAEGMRDANVPVSSKGRQVSRVNGAQDPRGDDEAADSNGDSAEVDDPGQAAAYERTTKEEEVGGFYRIKKKSAMDSLSAIEKCFASLRDKLYDERLAKCDAELAMLEGPDIKHPELLGMKEVLEQRRDEKIHYESTLLKYKLGSLQNKSTAETAQLHGQYMQTVRDIRDRSLEQVNKEWYQIHKERRSREEDVPEYMYQFPLRRSQQITDQTAYNKEVSLLSGIAKYRGFPAAPEIQGAKASDIDSDLERMGIIQQPAATFNRPPPTLRPSLSATVVLPRPNAVADEHFLEQNPWANPQHPAHLHRQGSAISRTVSPLAAAARPRRSSESIEGVRPASTLPGRHQEAYPSTSSNTVTGQQGVFPRLGSSLGAEAGSQFSKPSGPPPSSTEMAMFVARKQQGGLQESRHAALKLFAKAHPSASGRVQAPEMHMKPYIPKISRRLGSPSLTAASKLPASPSTCIPVIKAEEVSRLPGRSPTPQHCHPSPGQCG
ncbi:MAG: hypothetical protein LQ341_001528 [Variospora aurantia]|nr:MAG: hypothetical protein LQ341_001528 [Variospora aurantia]